MKRKLVSFALAVMPMFLCASCDIHFGDIHYDVTPWVIVIPVAAICVVICVSAHVSIIRKRFRCPMCQATFRPKWYEMSVWLHDGKRHVAKCPRCGRRGFCSPADD